jgi:hypothetical protein
MHTERFGAVLAVAIAGALLPHCALGGDAGGESGDTNDTDAGPLGNDDALSFGDVGQKACGCSGDLHSVLACDGTVLQTCPPDQRCSHGACVAACDAAVANKTSIGCEYFAHVPHARYRLCSAFIVANSWNAPVRVTGDVAGTTIDLTKYTYLPSGTGTSLKMTPVGQGGSIPPGQVGIVFLRDGEPYDNLGNHFDGRCGYGVVTAESDAAATGFTDPAYVGQMYYTADTAQAMHVTTSAPVVAYDIVPFGGGRTAITSSTLLLPTSTWGNNYVVAEPLFDGNSVTVIASVDNTTVTVKPSGFVTGSPSGTPKGAQGGTPMTFSMHAGQVLTLFSIASLSGSIVGADKPVGVWSESDCIMAFDRSGAGGACDASHTQLPPVSALGSEYVHARYRNRVDGQDEQPPTRITGAVDGTILTWDPQPSGAQATLDAGESFAVYSSDPFVVKSQDDKHPFVVSAFMTGGQLFEWGDGDPEFTGVVPAAQYLNKYVFFTDPTYPETNLVFVRAKGKDGAFHDVTLDCAGMLSGWQAVGASGAYEYVRRDLSRHDFVGQGGCDNGAHEAHSDAPFGLTVWGWGTAETGAMGTPGFSQWVSYAYPAGASVQSINDVVVPPK